MSAARLLPLTGVPAVSGEQEKARVTPVGNEKLLGTRRVQVGSDKPYHILSSFQMTNCSTCHH